MRVERLPAEVGDLEWASLGRGPTDERRFAVDRDGRAAVRAAQGCCRRRRGRESESAGSSYSMIEPPSVPVSRTALLTMLVQHLVEVEARADRLADLPQRLQLRDLAIRACASATTAP